MANPWPTGISLVTVSWGKGYTTLAENVSATLHLETIFGANNDYIVWGATGDPWLPFPVDASVAAGSVGTLQVPAVDQGGWVDPRGNPITNWHYRSTVSYVLGSQNVKIIRNFYPLVGGVTLDLDVIPDSGESSPVIVFQPTVRTVNGVGPDGNGNVPLTLSKAIVGLGNVDNTSDANKPVSAATSLAIQNVSTTLTNSLAQSNQAVATALVGKADLVNGLVPTSQIPALALTTAVPVTNQAAMLALTAAQVQPGDIAIRADGAGSFILIGADPSQLANWALLSNPAAPVSSVNGKTGLVTLAAADVGAEAAFAILAIAKLPAGSTLTVLKSGNSWPARPTSRTDIIVQWKGADPSPSIVTSGTTGMIDNVDIRLVTSA